MNTEPKLNSKSFLKVFEKGVLFDGGGGGKSWRVRQSSIQESSTSPSSYLKSSKNPFSTKSSHQLQDAPLRPRVVPEIQEFLQPRGKLNRILQSHILCITRNIVSIAFLNLLKFKCTKFEFIVRTEIKGPSVLRLPPGGTLSLQCTISRLNLPPKNLHWKHKKEKITSQTRPGVSLEFTKLSGESHTKLVIVDLKSSDEGTYQCATDVSRPATVQVFIGKENAYHLLVSLT